MRLLAAAITRLIIIPALVSSFSVKNIPHRDHGIRHYDAAAAPSSSTLKDHGGSRLRTTRLDDRKPKWLSESMGESVGDDEAVGEEARAVPPKLATGLSGFCLDAELGFVAILAAATAPDDETLRYVPVTVVPKSAGPSSEAVPAAGGMRSKLTSPQALTLVQLAGGLDLGTPVLPPDALWQTVVREGIDSAADDNDDDDDADEDDDLDDDGRSPPLVTLLGIDVVPNGEYDADHEKSRAGGPEDSATTPTKAAGWTEDWMDDDSREEAIRRRAPQVLDAVNGLPGLQGVTLEQVQNAMSYCANEEGSLDREGFSHLLDYVRRSAGVPSSTSASEGVNWKSDSKVMFVLNVNLVEQDSIKNVSVTTLDAFRAIGLSMRHKIQLRVAPACLEKDAGSILERFPEFRSVRELWEDAKIMDGFIPSMVAQSQKQRQDGPPPSQME